MKISARLLQDFLAGRITREQFQYISFGKDKNLFEHWLKMGFTFQDARFERAGHQSMNGQTNSLTSRRARKPCAGWQARRSPRKSRSPPLHHSSGYDSRRNCSTLSTHGLHQKL